VEISELTPEQKAAIFVLCIGKQRAARMLKNLDAGQIDRVTRAISEMSLVDPRMKEQVLKQFVQDVLSAKGGVMGGDRSAKEILEMSLGRSEANDYISRLKIGKKGDSDIYNILKTVDPSQLTNFLHSEQPQTIALVLSHLEPGQAASVLSGLNPDQQCEVAMRMATMKETSPDIVAKVASVVKRQLSSSIGQEMRSAGGAKTVAEILNNVDRATEKSILSSMEERNQELTDDIKKMMFIFEDVIHVEDRSMQRVLKEIDTSELALALKSASEEVQNKVFSNISKRAAELIKEEIEYMGPVRLKDVEEAQQRIVNVVRRLEEEGEVVIEGRGGSSEQFV
jgi:flagellar motor switch protein FliG